MQEALEEIEQRSQLSETHRELVKRLAGKMPDHIESALAMAQASLDARDFPAARAALASYLPAPTRRVATLMAEIEEAEGDVGRSREWMARAPEYLLTMAEDTDGELLLLTPAGLVRTVGPRLSDPVPLPLPADRNELPDGLVRTGRKPRGKA